MKICFDRILPAELWRPRRTMRVSGRTRAISPIGKTWINGSTLRVRFMGGTAQEHAVAREQAGWWEAVANLHFVFDNSGAAELRIAFDSRDGAWSYIGTDSRQISFSEPTMNLGFLDGGTAAHEFGHALGLAHEHANPEGGIQWNEQQVIDDLGGPPNYWDEETVRYNVFEKYAADQINGTAFDPDSIMLYAFPASWTLNGMSTHENEILSALDKQFIAGAKMYPQTDVVITEGVVLEVNAKKWTKASIGHFGDEDLFTFDAEGGNYRIDTKGTTDVVMKLFGPNSPTALIAEDDDSGYGLNARIRRPLTAGKYFIQVRHYNLARGTGSYSIKVRKV